MVATATGYALSISGLGELPVTLLDSESDRLLSARMSAAPVRSLVVRIAPTEEGDVTGHDLAAAVRSVVVRVRLDEDDVEGHALGVHFPTVAEADRFRKNLIAAGALAGTLVLAGAAGVGIASLPSGATTLPQEKPAAIERPIGRGVVAESVIVGEQPAAVVAGPATVAQAGVDEVTGKPVRSGVVQGTELERMPAPAVVAQRPAEAGPVEESNTAGPQETTPEGPGQPPTGGGPVEGR
jgi:hypothetical protein